MRLFAILATTLLVLVGCSKQGAPEAQTVDAVSDAPARTSFRVAWSRYPGWEPWGHAQRSGILKRWADQQGIRVDMVYVDSYVESIERYTKGEFDGCAMTNIDALTIPVAAGVDSTALIIGDYSNGNDGLVTRGASGIAELTGMEVLLVPLSVSHYLLDRAGQINGIAASSYTLVESAENTIVDALASRNRAAAVTWKPHLDGAAALPGARVMFDSAAIQGEILDLMVIRSDSPPQLRTALVGAWYETLAPLTSSDPQIRSGALAAMARDSGATADEYEAQLATTAMFYFAWDSAGYARSAALAEVMQRALDFAVRNDVLAAVGTSNEAVGIALADDQVIGNPDNIKFRFDVAPTRSLALESVD
jgi:NitT/TauT family transport system substrate-binding protein